ncbi:hypothetical protein A3Q56_00253 [Intoshia linei]|uniref:Nucleoplasmin core domain-containing protein n=1 Tax=Intoshia linei TaxID=1819745 RepID=A0A177BEG3_9BILA|nr:hypothetical protein A3Q56_00253 [Intoshia linei]
MEEIHGNIGIDNIIQSSRLWACVLEKSRPSHIWNKADEDGDTDFLIHSLHTKTFCLGVNAAKGERNIIQVETTTMENEPVQINICSLTLGLNDYASVELTFPSDKSVTFSLISGSGPVHIAGQEMTDLPVVNEEPPNVIMTRKRAREMNGNAMSDAPGKIPKICQDTSDADMGQELDTLSELDIDTENMETEDHTDASSDVEAELDEISKMKKKIKLFQVQLNKMETRKMA